MTSTNSTPAELCPQVETHETKPKERLKKLRLEVRPQTFRALLLRLADCPPSTSLGDLINELIEIGLSLEDRR